MGRTTAVLLLVDVVVETQAVGVEEMLTLEVALNGTPRLVATVHGAHQMAHGINPTKDRRNIF